MQLGPVMALVSGPTLAEALADPSSELTNLVAAQGDDAKLIDELFLRILNRPPTKAEVEMCRRDIQAVEEDHRRLAEELGRREAEFALKRPELERRRRAAIAAAQAALAAYEKELAPRLAERQRERAEAAAKLEADLKTYEATGFAKKLADWEKAHASAIVNRWVVLEPKAMSTTNRSVLKKEADGSISVSGRNKNGVVTLVVETELTGITGLRLEVLPDSRLPSKGPGRAQDGNFVLNELEVLAAPKAYPKQARPVKLTNALADFSQDSYPVANATDGNSEEAGNGWAVAPATGIVHWATFEAAQPVGAPGDTVLTINMHHKFENEWTLGRFRLSATRSPKPVGPSLPEDFRAVLAVAPELRTAAQKEVLLSYFRVMDAELKAKTEALRTSRAPLPVDERLQELRNRLEFARRPIQPDPALVALRRDVEMSVEQAAARRLTAAQDIAWALINSPAFLFNH
jgi:hypothetical protein